MEIRKLNTIRGIAALIVLISHYSNRAGFLGALLGNKAGSLGVMLFFVLSGFLMAYLYMGKSFTKEKVRNFAVARVARVIPLYLLVVLASYALQRLHVEGVLYPIDNLSRLLENLLLLTGTLTLWTIPPEIHFYALFVFLWWLYSKRAWYLFAVLFAAVVAIVLLGFPTPGWRMSGLVVYLHVVKALPYFLAGVAMGWLYRAWKPPSYLRRNVFVLALLAVPLLYPNIFIRWAGHAHAMWSDPGVCAVIAAVFFTLVFLVPDDNILLSNRLGDFLGKISYSLYLLHMPTLTMMLVPAQKHPELLFPIYVAGALLVAYVSYRLIEAPARAAIRSIVSSNRNRAPKETESATSCASE